METTKQREQIHEVGCDITYANQKSVHNSIHNNHILHAGRFQAEETRITVTRCLNYQMIAFSDILSGFEVIVRTAIFEMWRVWGNAEKASIADHTRRVFHCNLMTTSSYLV
jgi:hypothetical protein